jgi:hypothetical protein
MNKISKQFRILGISLSSPGFGYAAIEGENTLIDYGNKVFNDNKNARSLAGIERVIVRNQPDVLVLQDVNAKGTHRAPRIKELHRNVVAITKKHKLKVVEISATQLRVALLGEKNGTKYQIAELLAKRFPNELAPHLPPKRKAWKSEDRRMDRFDGVALVVVFRMQVE